MKLNFKIKKHKISQIEKKRSNQYLFGLGKTIYTVKHLA